LQGLFVCGGGVRERGDRKKKGIDLIWENKVFILKQS